MTDAVKFYRAFPLTRATGDAPPSGVALSSETPYERLDWMTGERYLEVLSHADGDVDLTYCRDLGDKLSILLEHDTDDLVGIAEMIGVADGVLRAGSFRFSQSQVGRDVAQDVADGIRGFVSIGYFRGETYDQSPGPDGIPIRRYRDWQPFEVSLVSVPADPTVGVGRSAPKAAPVVVTESPSPTLNAPEGQRTDMSDQKPDAPANGASNDAVKIAELAKSHGLPELGMDLVTRGVSLVEAQDAFIRALAARKPEPVAVKPEAPAAPAVHTKGARTWSLSRAMVGAAERQAGGQPKIDDGYEREVQQEILSRGYAGERGGIVIPIESTSMYRTRLAVNATSQGAQLIFTAPGDFIPLLRNRAQTVAMGAQVMSGLSASISMPRALTASSGQWLGENPGSNVTESSLTLGSVTLSPKTFLVSTSFTRLLQYQAPGANVQADALALDDLEKVVALELDRVGIHGTGSSNQPRGILATTGVSTTVVTGGANGAAPSWVNITQLPAIVAAANADVDGMGYLTTPEIRGRLQAISKFTAYAEPVWGEASGPLNGFNARVTNQISKTLVKGTNSDCHAIVFGDWSQLVYGIFGGVEIVVDPYALKKQGVIEATAYLAADTAVRQPGAFAAMIDARNV